MFYDVWFNLTLLALNMTSHKITSHKYKRSKIDARWDLLSHQSNIFQSFIFYILFFISSLNPMFLLWSVKSENGIRFNINLSMNVGFNWKLNHSFSRSIGIKCFILVLISWQNNIKKLKLSTRKGSVVWGPAMWFVWCVQEESITR